MEKVYHIYAKDKCLYHNLPENEFEKTWNSLTTMVGLLKTDYCSEDLTYEELTVQKNQEASY